MKKIALSVLSILLVMFFVSCGKQEGETTEPEAPGTEVKAVTSEEVLESIANARQLAIDSGAEQNAVNLLDSVDEKYTLVKADAEQGKDIVDAGTDVANRYLALAAYLKARDARIKLEETELTSLASDLYNQGCAAMSDTETLFNNPESTGAQQLEKATEASTCLNSALILVYKTVAKNERLNALDAKKKADSVKAGVTEKTAYGDAVAAFKKGDSLFSMQDPVNAYDNYKSAYETFSNIFVTVSEKRAAAEKAIEEAKKSVEESAVLAANADVRVPLTEPTEGIEAEDAVLLEEDNYADPSSVEVELSEEVSDPVQDMIDQGVNNLDFDDRNAK